MKNIFSMCGDRDRQFEIPFNEIKFRTEQETIKGCLIGEEIDLFDLDSEAISSGNINYIQNNWPENTMIFNKKTLEKLPILNTYFSSIENDYWKSLEQKRFKESILNNFVDNQTMAVLWPKIVLDNK